MMRDFESQWTAWMREANSGNAASYRRVLEALIPFLRQTVRKVLPASAAGEAEDIVQETLLAIHLKRQTWDEARPIVPWVRAIARNKMIDHLRRLSRNDRVSFDDIESMLPPVSMDETGIARDTEKLLSTLNGRPRRILHAVAIEGLTLQEVAGQEKMSNGAVRVALHRSLKALAAAFRESNT
jgi:RNA polymerase sigma-70 factor, ECF subfamily